MTTRPSIETILEIYKQSPKRKPDDIFDWIKWVAEAGGTKYPVTGNWKTALQGVIHEDEDKSKYKNQVDDK